MADPRFSFWIGAILVVAIGGILIMALGLLWSAVVRWSRKPNGR